jgi:hypothetical protein
LFNPRRFAHTRANEAPRRIASNVAASAPSPVYVGGDELPRALLVE